MANEQMKVSEQVQRILDRGELERFVGPTNSSMHFQFDARSEADARQQISVEDAFLLQHWAKNGAQLISTTNSTLEMLLEIRETIDADIATLRERKEKMKL